jgi:hypothetical protein
MASSVTGPKSEELLPVGTPEGTRLCSPAQDYRRSRGKTSSNPDNGQCQQVDAVPENAERLTVL